MKKTSDTPLSTSDTSEPAEKPTNENEKNFSDYFTDQHVFLVFLVLVIFGVIFFTSDRDLGTFGDFFGGTLNPILTFISVIFLISTIKIQQTELSLTRKELMQTRLEYKNTSNALNTQAIENTFFNILKLHNDISLNLNSVNGFLYENDRYKAEYKGKNVFINILNEVKRDRSHSFKENKPDVIYNNYLKIQNNHNHILGQYFINLYQALKLIDNYSDQVLSLENKKKYSSILRAQLSTKELAVLFLNCLDGVCDKGQFKNLLIKYSILEHLPIVQIDSNTFELANDINVSGEMIQQYKEKKEIESQGDEEKYGGAFGKNKAIPADYEAPPF
ncbi:putative phage abortive infection protein [Yersinia rohdei]|uniref:putative phage abortive infection protein n=1 Tax=Yersinia rohdei TaxID=29485 RepID=UPI0011A16A57|nr:putative phage abortive infection protein [Yersinia rohdei]